jgi:HEXXH motif-containing protein
MARRRLDLLAGELRGLSSAGPKGRDLPDVAALLVSKGKRIVSGGRVPEFEIRLRHAVALLRRAWPAAAEMVLARTQRVVPIDEAGIVSFSSAREPGVAYINVHSRPLVRLAEDLLHEATHMRLHEIEALYPLVVPRERYDDAEPRFYSPWRREWRPVRGILHGACTFTVGAAFYERMLEASDPGTHGVVFPAARRRWLARRFLEEMESTSVALATLRGASRRGLLLPAGRRIVRAAASLRSELLDAARVRERELRTSPSGRIELRRSEAFKSRLAAKPLRFEWDGES